MYTHRIVVDLPIIGRAVIFFEYTLRRLPTKGKEKAYCATTRTVVEFDFSEILESEVTNFELV